MSQHVVSGQFDQGGRGGLAAAFVFALGVHAAALVAMIYWHVVPTPQPAAQQIAIDLSPEMTEAEAQPPEEEGQEQRPEEVKPIETPPEEAPPEVAEVKPEETPPEETTAVPPP